MTGAHEVIEVPDYSTYLHTQTVMTRADQLVPGDEVLIPEEQLHNALPALRGQVYRVTLSQPAAAHDGPGWTVLTFAAAMVRFRTEPHDEFHRVVEHDPPTCAYCLARFEQSKRHAAQVEKNRQEIMARAEEATNLMRDVGFASWHRPQFTMVEQLEAQGAPYSADEINHMRENGAG